MKKQKIVVLTGAGISAESGIATFRAADGLWEGHDVMAVASPAGWRKNQELVLNFYNQRRKTALEAEPNPGHYALVELEQKFDVTIITQNVDNLHERAGSRKVMHLHGSLFESRSTLDETLIYPINGWELKKGDLCGKKSQLRPNIVWFGEMVPLMEKAIEETIWADIFMVIGTSLAVYPAASLIQYVPSKVPVYIIDPQIPELGKRSNLHLIPKKAGVALPTLVKELMQGSY